MEAGMSKKYVVKLTAEERNEFERLSHTGKSAAWKILHAQALLKMDQGEGGPAWSDAQIAEAFGMTVCSIESWRRQAVEDGPESLFEREYARRPEKRRLDGDGEAQLVKLACSQAPDDRESWTLSLLRDKIIELRMTDTISRETIRKVLKKTSSSHG
jgi:transposase